MFKKLLKSIAIISVFGLVSFFGILIFKSASTQAANRILTVSVQDLSQAGFSNVQKILPETSGRYDGPNLYFSVSDLGQVVKSSTAHIVMIDNLLLPYQPAAGALFKYGANSRAFQISSGAGKIATITDGRTAINFIKGDHYVVVIGPDQARVEALATALANKIQ